MDNDDTDIDSPKCHYFPKCRYCGCYCDRVFPSCYCPAYGEVLTPRTCDGCESALYMLYQTSMEILSESG